VDLILSNNDGMRGQMKVPTRKKLNKKTTVLKSPDIARKRESLRQELIAE